VIAAVIDWLRGFVPGAAQKLDDVGPIGAPGMTARLESVSLGVIHVQSMSFCSQPSKRAAAAGAIIAGIGTASDSSVPGSLPIPGTRSHPPSPRPVLAVHLDLLRLEAGALPRAPGVYFWKDAEDRILYIGKAVNLRSRVTSYFSHARQDRRTRKLLHEARHITFEVTGTELEALFRESALIKREQPPYNRVLKRSRRLSYLRLADASADPWLEITSEPGVDDTLSFGPFPSRTLARETLAFLHDVLPLRKCAAARPRCRPCLYFQMGKCAAPLLDAEHRVRHQEAISRLHDVLDGRTDRVAAWLTRKRDRLSESLLFEQAAEVQARLDALNDHRRQHAILDAAVQCRCVLVNDGVAAEQSRVLLVARGHVLSARPTTGLEPETLSGWVTAHGPIIAAAVKEQNELDAASVLERWLHQRRRDVRWVTIPQNCGRGDLIDRCAYVLGAAVTSARPAFVGAPGAASS
jgi:excinuclease ABC subunit C